MGSGVPGVANRSDTGATSGLKSDDPNDEREDRQRNAGLGVLGEGYADFATRALDDDQVGDRAEERKVSGQRGRHREGEPGANRIREFRHDGLENEHGRNIADEIREDSRKDRHRGSSIETVTAGEGEEIRRQRRFLDAGDDDEQAREHGKQTPVDLVVYALGLHTSGDQEQSAGGQGDLRNRESGKKEDDHRGRGHDRFPEQDAMDTNGLVGERELVRAAKFGAINGRDYGDCEEETGGGDWSERRGERPVGDARKAADHHVLGIAGDGRDAADVRRHGDGEQIRDRIAAQAFRDLEDERRQDEAHRVIDEEGGEDAGHRDNPAEQPDRPACVFNDPCADEREEAGQAQVGDDDHHAEQEHDGLVVDGGVGFGRR